MQTSVAIIYFQSLESAQEWRQVSPQTFKTRPGIKILPKDCTSIVYVCMHLCNMKDFLPPSHRECLVEKIKEVPQMLCEISDSFFYPCGPWSWTSMSTFQRSSCCKLCYHNQSNTAIQALRLIQKFHSTIIYFQAAASSISALSESNQSNSKLYPKKWASGIDSKGQ